MVPFGQAATTSDMEVRLPLVGWSLVRPVGLVGEAAHHASGVPDKWESAEPITIATTSGSKPPGKVTANDGKPRSHAVQCVVEAALRTERTSMGFAPGAELSVLRRRS